MKVIDGKCIEGDCKNGYGILVFTNGARYEGNWDIGRMDPKMDLVSTIIQMEER